MHAQYADGRAALYYDIECEIGADGFSVLIGDVTQHWPYADLARTDDNNGRIVVRRKPDTGERLMFLREHEAALKAAAPALFKPRAQGVEGIRTIGGVALFSWSLAAAFLVGVPLMAAPIADVVPGRYRDQIADLSWGQSGASVTFCDDSDEAARILNDMAYRMMTAANVRQRDDIWITIVDDDIPNAWALPDNSIVITDDLIALAEDPDEIAGVLAHEIAHIEHNHIMTGMVRQMGAGMFFDVVFGGAGAGQAIAIASVNLTGLRYSRGDESDADSRGLDYLEAAGIDTGALAVLFQRVERYMQEHHAGDIPTLLSSHPASAGRADVARARAGHGRGPSLSAAEWQIVRSACGGLAAPPAESAPAGGSQPLPAGPPPSGAPQPSKPEAPSDKAFWIERSTGLPSPRTPG